MKKMIIRKINILAVLSLVLVFTSCKDKTNYDVQIAEEERYFQLYMDANYPDSVPTESGLYYFEYKKGTGETPDKEDYILINYLAYTIPDEAIVDTYTEEWARAYNLYNSQVLYGPYKVKLGNAIEGMAEGISKMKEGGISRLIFKSDLGYGAESVGDIGKFESLMYDIELVEVIGDAAVREQEQIDAYLTGHTGADTITDPETGVNMYYFPVVVGDSSQIKKKSKVEVYYTGQLLDGRVFDTNAGNSTGMQVTVGKEEVIAGWDLGLKSFKYGGTGKLLIPHELAYGEEGSKLNNSNKTSIPPFEALLFDIEVTKLVID